MNRSSRRTSSTLNYNGVLDVEPLRRGPVLEPALHVRELRLAVHGPHQGHAPARPVARQRPVQLAHVLRRLRPREARQRATILVKGTYFLSTRRPRLAQHRPRLRQLRRASARRTTTSRAATTASSRRASIVQNGDIYPGLRRRTRYVYYTPIYHAHAGHEHADALRVPERLVAAQRPPLVQPRRALRQERRQEQRRRRRPRTTSAFSPRLARELRRDGQGQRSASRASYAHYVGGLQDAIAGQRLDAAASPRRSTGTTTARRDPINVGRHAPARSPSSRAPRPSSRSSTGSSRRAARTSRRASCRSAYASVPGLNLQITADARSRRTRASTRSASTASLGCGLSRTAPTSSGATSTTSTTS